MIKIIIVVSYVVFKVFLLDLERQGRRTILNNISTQGNEIGKKIEGKIWICFVLESKLSFILTSALQLVTWKVGFSWPFTDKQTIVLNKIFDNFPIVESFSECNFKFKSEEPVSQKWVESTCFNFIDSTIQINNCEIFLTATFPQFYIPYHSSFVLSGLLSSKSTFI